ncbi:hypothetical protein D3C83_50200 [compost metagenome]
MQEKQTIIRCAHQQGITADFHNIVWNQRIFQMVLFNKQRIKIKYMHIRVEIHHSQEIQINPDTTISVRLHT